MNKIKTKVISSEVGKFEVDSIAVKVDGAIISICFEKDCNITQYDGKDIYLINNDGVYTVEPYVDQVSTTKK